MAELWVGQEQDIQPEQVILQLHGGAYIRSLADNGATYRHSSAVRGSQRSQRWQQWITGWLPNTLSRGAGGCGLDLLASRPGIPAGEHHHRRRFCRGGLALATVVYLRDNGLPLPAGLITMSAWTDLDYERWTPPYVGSHSADNPYISPVYGDYTGFPPLLMQVGVPSACWTIPCGWPEKPKQPGVCSADNLIRVCSTCFRCFFLSCLKRMKLGRKSPRLSGKSSLQSSEHKG